METKNNKSNSTESVASGLDFSYLNCSIFKKMGQEMVDTLDRMHKEKTDSFCQMMDEALEKKKRNQRKSN